jgi:2-polyprenyl-3-methyl-5-hydroxy-6-metoxy-1,4-benzoquinol methylase
MSETCDLCHASALERVYQPVGGRRGIFVHICAYCGLLQSLPRIDRAPRRQAAVSSGADWGNVRYGKGFRTQQCLAVTAAHADFRKSLTLLDVGSNRGSFTRAFLEAAPKAQITCVEPDERVADSCSSLSRADLIRSRIEETRFADASFDIVHSCHTLEHLASPATILADHWRVLKPGGLLVLDVPNVALVGGDDVLEEWFIDKHLYHFSKSTLACLLDASGFEIIDGPDEDDRENILVAAVKRSFAGRPVRTNPPAVEDGMAVMRSYVMTRAQNLSLIKQVAADIEKLAPSGVALWGAGRLFDALVLHGGFNPKKLRVLIDVHLKKHVPERHGVAVSGPEALSTVNPAFIVVMSRAFAGEIAAVASKAAPKAEMLLYSDLLARARVKLAA